VTYGAAKPVTEDEEQADDELPAGEAEDAAESSPRVMKKVDVPEVEDPDSSPSDVQPEELSPTENGDSDGELSLSGSSGNGNSEPEA
jgi:hypothetical protein